MFVRNGTRNLRYFNFKVVFFPWLLCFVELYLTFLDHVAFSATPAPGAAETQRLFSGGEERLGSQGGDGLPPTDEDEIHGGGRPRRHVSGSV